MSGNWAVETGTPATLSLPARQPIPCGNWCGMIVLSHPVAIELPRIQGPWHSPAHQLAVAGPFRRLGVATLLMDAAEDLARGRGIAIPASPFGYVTNTDPPNGCMPSAATFRMAGEHAVARCH